MGKALIGALGVFPSFPPIWESCETTDKHCMKIVVLIVIAVTYLEKMLLNSELECRIFSSTNQFTWF